MIKSASSSRHQGCRSSQGQMWFLGGFVWGLHHLGPFLGICVHHQRRPCPRRSLETRKGLVNMGSGSGGCSYRHLCCGYSKPCFPGLHPLQPREPGSVLSVLSDPVCQWPKEAPLVGCDFGRNARCWSLGQRSVLGRADTQPLNHTILSTPPPPHPVSL